MHLRREVPELELEIDKNSVDIDVNDAKNERTMRKWGEQ